MFEVITEKEFKGSGGTLPVSVSQTAGVTVGTEVPPDDTSKIYCDFCKGWYYEEYHYGDQDESSR